MLELSRAKNSGGEAEGRAGATQSEFTKTSSNFFKDQLTSGIRQARSGEGRARKFRKERLKAQFIVGKHQISMNYDSAYLIASALLFLIWLILYVLKPQSRRKMLLVSFLTTPLGLTEPLFVPSYWLPFTLFDLARRTRFDLESLLFSFAVGGITTVLYESLWGKLRKPVSVHERHQGRHRFHRLALLSPLIVFGILYFLTPFNPIYSSIIAMTIGAVATWFCRPDLLKAMLTGSILFLVLYFV